MPILPDLLLPKDNKAVIITNNSKSAKCSARPDGSTCILPLHNEPKRAYLLKQATKSHPLERISNRRRSTQNDKRRQRRIQEAASNCIIRLSPGNENKKRLAAKKHRFCIQYSDNGREVNFKQMGLEPDWGSVNQGFKICGGWKSVDVHFIFSKYSQLIGDWLWFDYKPGCEPLKMGDK